MKKEFFDHPVAYVILVLGLVGFTLLFLAVWPNHTQQRIVAVGIATFYAGWGILTHVHSASISKKVAGEYIGMSILALVILLLVTE